MILNITTHAAIVGCTNMYPWKCTVCANLQDELDQYKRVYNAEHKARIVLQKELEKHTSWEYINWLLTRANSTVVCHLGECNCEEHN